MTAAGASWQLNGEPVAFQGLVYQATREFRAFDGQVMSQLGLYQGVPVFADLTLEPFSIVYIPVGRDRMRSYVRPRDGQLAGTTGSRAPSFPVRGTSKATAEDRPVGTAGTIVPSAVGAMELTRVPDRTRPTRTTIESIPRTAAPNATNGIWLEFSGSRWYAAGQSVSFRSDRFTPIGEYRGFPVYRATSGEPDRIWVSVVQDGPLAPYEKR